MNAILFGQLTYIVVIVIITLIAAAFMLYSPVRKTTQAQTVTGYFAAFFFLTCFAFLFFLARPFISEGLSVLLTNILFLTNIYALKHGLMWRKGYFVHLHENHQALGHIGLFVLAQMLLFFAVQESQVWRTINHSINTVAVIALLFPLVKLGETDNDTFGEKAVSTALVFSVIGLCTAPMFYLLSPTTFHFQSLVMLLQVISIVAMIGGLQSLLLSDTINRHYESSIRDPLTGIYNRRYFFEEVKEVAAMQQPEDINSVILCDIDKFKSVNDNYGHDVGDTVIINVAHIITDLTGNMGTVSRFGGEEFTVLLRHHCLRDAIVFAEQLREAVEAIEVPTNKGMINVTASFGVAEVWELPDIDLTIKLADQALLQAKAHGRNQVRAG